MQKYNLYNSPRAAARHNGKNFNIVYLPFFFLLQFDEWICKVADTLFRVNWLELRCFLSFLLRLAFILVGLKKTFHLCWAQGKKKRKVNNSRSNNRKSRLALYSFRFCWKSNYLNKSNLSIALLSSLTKSSSVVVFLCLLKLLSQG